jgi:hypothetical protein
VTEQIIPWQTTAAVVIHTDLGRDDQLATCGLAKASGPDATLACDECGRALWMHSTRHDTCGQFCWVTARSITDKQIGQLGTIAGLPDEIRHACFCALTSYAQHRAWGEQTARQLCASAINSAKRAAWKHSLKQAEVAA